MIKFEMKMDVPGVKNSRVNLNNIKELTVMNGKICCCNTILSILGIDKKGKK